MTDTWTPDWELKAYWDKLFNSPELMESYYKELEGELRVFNPIIKKHFEGKPKVPVIIDIGGGGFDGVFNFIRIGEREIIIDPLIDEFKKRYNLIPADRECINAYSYDIPLESSIADVVFCINTLDHCNSELQFLDSLSEIYRILKPDGMLFLMLPIRDDQRDGHFIYNNNVARTEILNKFRGYTILHSSWDHHCFYMGAKKI